MKRDTRVSNKKDLPEGYNYDDDYEDNFGEDLEKKSQFKEKVGDLL